MCTARYWVSSSELPTCWFSAGSRDVAAI
ncbi:hypothetical protein [Nocardia asiatica]